MLNDDTSNVDANVETSITTTPPANVQTNERTMSTHVVERNDNATLIAKLIAKLPKQSRNEQKRTRRQLRALNHFGGRRERSSRYVTIDDKNRVKINRDALRERAKRDAKRDIANENDE